MYPTTLSQFTLAAGVGGDAGTLSIKQNGTAGAALSAGGALTLSAPNVVQSGTVVTARILGDEEVFLLGSREIVGEDSDLDVYSEGSPLGAAILGHKVGETVEYTAPNGKQIAVSIDKVETYTP